LFELSIVEIAMIDLRGIFPMLRRIGTLTIGSLFLLPLWGCGDANVPPPQSQGNPPAIVRNDPAPQAQNIKDGQYPLQQASFDDGSGIYTLMVLNTPEGMDANLQLSEVKMARLTDEQVKAGEKSYLKVENDDPTLYLTEDFKIDYTHNVTEVKANPQTGVQETVVVRRESTSWSPFFGSMAGSIAGQAIGSMLFRPQYYMPPMYQPGMGMFGHGGYGSSYGGAVTQYRDRYQQAPIVERNRTNFRSTGQLSDSGSNVRTKPQAPRANVGNDPRRSTGSGFGSSDLRKTGKTYKSPSIGGNQPRRSGSFGSGGRARMGGGRRR
jgi:hypothetical protein